jgi:polyvinyl alcohol dehydrogenase (cytochrome)
MFLSVGLAACSGAVGRAGSSPHPASHAGKTPAATQLSATSAPGSVNWTVYHHDLAGSGDVSGIDLSHLKKSWTSKSLDGQLYGEPLVLGSTLYVATENDSVYALSASTGRVLWRHHLATPVPSNDLPCGNISPTVGITSTPVIDVARKEIFVVADELVKGRPHHKLFGLALANGKTELSEGVDPHGADAAAILQRASLTLDGTRVVFGYGGNSGDCSTYHGWVESVPVTGGKATFFEVDDRPGDYQGAIWMGGAAPIVTKNGDIYVAAGNGSATARSAAFDDSDSVLELSSSLKLLHYFAPSDWRSDNASDSDLGSAAPAVLPNGLIVQAGKSRTIYLLRSSLGGIGHQLQQKTNECGADFDGGVAFSGGTVYLPCEAGVMAVLTNATHHTMKVLWQTSSGAGGPPILAGGLVWSMGGGNLYALSAKSGNIVEQFSVGSSATDFPTPSVGDGRLYATSADQVHAFVER